jgi:pilus assembly protein CpaF
MTDYRQAATISAALSLAAGPLAGLLTDTQVTDVLVNGREVWVDRGSGLARAPIHFESLEDVRRIAQRMAAHCGRRLDDGSPFVDAQLPDGTRVHAVLPPLATAGPYLSLRTMRPQGFGLDQLVHAGTVDPDCASLLAAIVAERLAFLVTGGAGAGKSTLLCALLGLVPAHERIVIVEDAAELRPAHPHVVGLQARTANVEGAGQIGLRDLVRQALRMRPDRLVVGECRGAEVLDLLCALNTGLPGGAATLHANTARDAPLRLEALGLLGGVPREAVRAQIAAGLQVVIAMRREPTGRRVEEICMIEPGPDGGVLARTCWHNGEPHTAHGSGHRQSARGTATSHPADRERGSTWRSTCTPPGRSAASTTAVTNGSMVQ